jgi:hypothetical protein
MAYVINRYDGQAITTVEDGTVDQTLDLKLVGKNYAGYGEIQNENFVHLLENFARETPPTNAIRGQLWYDTVGKKIKFYTGDSQGGIKIFKTAGGVEYSLAAPSNPTSGDLWFDSSVNQLKVFVSTEWLTVGPQTAGTGTTQLVSRQVKDNVGNLKSIITAIVNDEVVYIIAKDAFTIDPTDAPSTIVGLYGGVVKKGITLVNTSGDGVSGVLSSHVFWGTSSSSRGLVDNSGNFIPTSDFVTSGNSNFTATVSFSDLGQAIGDNGDLKLFIENGIEPVIQNVTGPNITFRVNDSGTEKDPMILKPTGLEPSITNTYNLGSSTKKWGTVFATTFSGTATQADTLKVGSEGYLSASKSSTPNTIAVRDVNGNLVANIFSGTATSAKYADLAEKYLTDKGYEPGTVVVVGGTAEVTASQSGQRAIGAISTNPAYMMNSELQGGQYVALKGRVPVKVAGPVTKGARMIAGNDGCAIASESGIDVFAIALETSDEAGTRLVECLIL